MATFVSLMPRGNKRVVVDAERVVAVVDCPAADTPFDARIEYFIPEAAVLLDTGQIIPAYMSAEKVVKRLAGAGFVIA